MAEARQLKTGRWRIYQGSGLDPVRDPETRAIVTFANLEAACRWWSRVHPNEPPLAEANKCTHCGSYFGPTTESTLFDGQYYHSRHTPGALVMRRRNWGSP
jgi:hypothetical protein